LGKMMGEEEGQGWCGGIRRPTMNGIGPTDSPRPSRQRHRDVSPPSMPVIGGYRMKGNHKPHGQMV
jgi:hypothetical protein